MVTDDCVHTLTPLVSPVTAIAKSLSNAELAEADGDDEIDDDGETDAEELGLVLRDPDAETELDMLADGVPSEAEAEIELDTEADILVDPDTDIELETLADVLADMLSLGDDDTLADTDADGV